MVPLSRASEAPVLLHPRSSDAAPPHLNGGAKKDRAGNRAVLFDPHTAPGHAAPRYEPGLPLMVTWSSTRFLTLETLFAGLTMLVKVERVTVKVPMGEVGRPVTSSTRGAPSTVARLSVTWSRLGRALSMPLHS